MKLASFEAIVRALHEYRVRYLIAGGMAVSAHGYVRFTKDVDLVLQLLPANILRAFAALAPLGYKPIIPVTPEQFADPATRESWVRDKNMMVLQLWSDTHRETPIDLFAAEPFNFDDEYEHALIKPLYGQIAVRFVSVRTLLVMKQNAGRDQDKIDVEQLRLLMTDDDRE